MFDEIKAKLGLDITDFERGLVRSVEQAKQAQKDITAARTAQARETNRSLTADQGKSGKSAKDSAAVFEQAMAAEEEIKNQRLRNEEEIANVKRRSIDDQRKTIIRGLDEEDNKRRAMTQRMDRGIKALAAAAGLNMQSIAESIARFVTGFSTDAEEKLKNLVESTGRAADAQEAARDRAIERNKKMREDVAKGEDDVRFNRLSDEQKLDELLKKRASLQSKSINTKEGSGINLQARQDLLDVNKQIEEVEDSIFQKTIGNAKSVKDAEENLSDTRKKIALSEASDAEKIVILNEAIADAKKAVTDAGKDQQKQAEAQTKLVQTEFDLREEKDRQSKQNAERIKDLIKEIAAAEIKVLDSADDQNAAARAQIELQQARKKLSEEQAKITEKTANFSATVNDAENKRAKAIADKIDSLFGRAATLEKTLAEAKRKAELPTMAEVASGQRDIGVRSREDAKKLAAEEAKIKKLSDNETRLKGQLANAKTAGDRKNIIEEGRQNRAQLDAARARADALRKSLGEKISDVPFADQEKAAKEASDAAAKAQAEANKPKPEAKPVVPPAAPELKPAEAKPVVPPVSAAEAAATAAQNAVQAAQSKLTSTTGRGVGDMSGISSDLSSCVRILGDIKTRLDPTSISTT